MYTDLARSDRQLADLGQMLRAGLTGDAAPTWSLAEERTHTEHFLGMMLARFGDRLSVRWRIEDGTRAAQVPRFTLQLLVENAITHNQLGGREPDPPRWLLQPLARPVSSGKSAPRA